MHLRETPACLATCTSNAASCFRFTDYVAVKCMPAGEMVGAYLRVSLAIRTCPHAGHSSASCTMACSVFGATPFFRIGFCWEIFCSSASSPVSYSFLKR